jgi:hypothetical protein
MTLNNLIRNKKAGRNRGLGASGPTAKKYDYTEIMLLIT